MEAVLYFKNVFLMSIYLFLDFRFVSLSLNSTKKKFHQILKNQGTVYNLPGIVANIFSFQTGLVPWMFLNIYNSSAKVFMIFGCMILISRYFLTPPWEN